MLIIQLQQSSPFSFLVSCFSPHIPFFCCSAILKQVPDIILFLVNKDVFPFWHGPCLALKVVRGVALRRMILERLCNVFPF